MPLLWPAACSHRAILCMHVLRVAPDLRLLHRALRAAATGGPGPWSWRCCDRCGYVRRFPEGRQVVLSRSTRKTSLATGGGGGSAECATEDVETHLSLSLRHGMVYITITHDDKSMGVHHSHGSICEATRDGVLPIRMRPRYLRPVAVLPTWSSCDCITGVRIVCCNPVHAKAVHPVQRYMRLARKSSF